MDADRGRAYSTLEAVPSQPEVSQSSAEGREVGPDDGKEHIIYACDGAEVVAKEDPISHDHGHHHGRRRVHPPLEQLRQLQGVQP